MANEKYQYENPLRLEEITSWAAIKDPDFTIRVHAGETDIFNNVEVNENFITWKNKFIDSAKNDIIFVSKTISDEKHKKTK